MRSAAASNTLIVIAVTVSAKTCGNGRSPRGLGPLPVEAARGYKLLEFGNEFFAVPLTLGPVDVRDAECRRLPGLFAANSLTAVRTLTLRSICPPRSKVRFARKMYHYLSMAGLANELYYIGHPGRAKR